MNTSLSDIQKRVLAGCEQVLRGRSFLDIAAAASTTEVRHTLELGTAIAYRIAEAGGFALAVGGLVRDEARRQHEGTTEPHDVDVEVYGLPLKAVQGILSQFGQVNTVGQSFQVMKVGDLDVALPRRDSKTGFGHTGFEVVGDPNMTLKDAARRRDFTINALAMNPLTGAIYDPCNGIHDLRQRLVRVVDVEHFAEDSLRAIRAMRFVAQLEYELTDETIRLCRALDLTDVPTSRIGAEWDAMLAARRPSLGLKAAHALGIVLQLYPELADLMETPQDPVWHPEGNVWVHTIMVVDEAAQIAVRNSLPESVQRILMYAAMCHDLGKPSTTRHDAMGRITSHNHAAAGARIAQKFLKKFNVSGPTIEHVQRLVAEHMVPLVQDSYSDTAVRRLAVRLAPATIRQLLWLSEADLKGRGTVHQSMDRLERLRQQAERLDILECPPHQLLQGADILALGVMPGPEVGRILGEVYEAMLRGEIATRPQALELAKEICNHHRAL